DPGAFSSGFEGLAGLDAILITHQHQDHLVVQQVRALLGKSPRTKVLADEGSAKLLAAAGVAAQAVRGGRRLEVAGVPVEGIGEWHAVIHPEIERIPDMGYLIAERFYYPGDAFTQPGRPGAVLAVP